MTSNNRFTSTPTKTIKAGLQAVPNKYSTLDRAIERFKHKSQRLGLSHRRVTAAVMPNLMGRLLYHSHGFFRHVPEVKLTQGDGKGKANELGIPGHAGTLDTLAGVDDGRAWKLAKHPLMTGKILQDVLDRSDGQAMANPGAYVSQLVEDAPREARKQEQRETNLRFEAGRERLAAVDDSIDELPDDQLQAAIDSMPALEGLSPDAVRADPAFRKEVVQRLMYQQGAETEAAGSIA